jgi:tRNA nucleotidyltransferase (CCA-adding enzyme)
MQIVTTHKNTDFDALASMFAAKMLYPDAIPVVPKAVNPNVKAFLSLHKDIFNPVYVSEIDLDQVTSLIVVDVNNWQRLDQMMPLKDKSGLEIILWDHHENDGDIEADWKCQEAAGATVTLIVRQLKKERKILTPIQSTLFLAGIYEDTGHLSFSNVGAEDAHAAGYLLERKADLSIVNSLLRPAYGEKQKNILFMMLQKADRQKIRGFNVSINCMEVEGHVQGLSMVVKMYRELINVDAAFGIFVNKKRDKCMVIGRSLPDTIDIGEVMRCISGGGHPGAGSAVLDGSDGTQVAAIIKAEIDGSQQKSVSIVDLMSFPVFSIPPETTMKEVALILREKGCSGLPVVGNERLEGIISRRDFRKIRNESKLVAPVKAFMSRKNITISPDKSPQDATRIMVKYDIGRLPVVDETGRIIGIVTRTDTMRYFYDLLPD